MLLPTFQSAIFALTVLTTTINAYRPTQFCKHRGENGKAEMCFALNQHHNTSTDQFDVYITLETWRFKDSSKGWAAMGLGKMMIGALMFIIYGDPLQGTLTTSVRTATGHHPPFSVLGDQGAGYDVPEIQIGRSGWMEYDGDYFNDKLQLKPTHVGFSEIVCYGCAKWSGFPIGNETTYQEMIWSTNSVQEWHDDFSIDRGIEMHQFGLGFGFLWTDMLNAEVTGETPFWPKIDEMKANLGMDEYTVADAPTEEELADGAKIIEEHNSGTGTDSALDDIHAPASTSTVATSAISSTPSSSTISTALATDAKTPPPAPTSTFSTTDDDSPIYPAPTLLGKSLRAWLWTLHGLLMSLSFLLLYPLGSYFMRSPRPTAFNLHWTIQSLSTVSVLVSAGIGYWQSHSISVAHQFIGFSVVGSVLVQSGLGYWHHRKYVNMTVKHSTIYAWTHRILGPCIMGTGLVNLVMGLLLAGHSHTIVSCGIAAVVAVVIGLTYVLGKDHVRQLAMGAKMGGGGAMMGNDGVRTRAALGQEAEEYFQLAGDDDDDEDSDDGGVDRVAERRERQERLARLDKV